MQRYKLKIEYKVFFQENDYQIDGMLTQGIFVGAVSDNFDERIDQKIFHAEIVVDSVKVSAEMKAYILWRNLCKILRLCQDIVLSIVSRLIDHLVIWLNFTWSFGFLLFGHLAMSC